MANPEEIAAQAEANRKAAESGERPKSFPSDDVILLDPKIGSSGVYDGENDSPEKHSGS